MGGVSNLKSQLYASPPEGQLQVTPRRRLKAIFVGDSAAASTTTFFAHVIGALPDILQPADAILFDLILLEFTAAGAAGLSLANAATVISAPGGNNSLALGQNLTTLTALATVGGAIIPVNLTPTPALFTSIDFEFLLNEQLGGLKPTDQPLTMQFNYGITNSTAGAITLSAFAFVFYRLVRGLQEN